MISRYSAPGKIILFGEHFVVHGASAILAAIDRRVTVKSQTISEKKIVIRSNSGKTMQISTDPSNHSSFDDMAEFKPFFYIAQKMISESKHGNGIEIDIHSDIPANVGLGSSSACCVAVAASASNLFFDLSREEILKLSIEGEKTMFKDVSGADNTICTYGGIILYNKRNGFTKIDNHRINDIRLLIINSGQTHITNDLVKRVQKFKSDNSILFDELLQKESFLINGASKILGGNNDNSLVHLGRYMEENQSYLEQIGISNDVIHKIINNVYSDSNDTVYGTKITGAGGGGCVIALVDNSSVNNVMERLKKDNYECFISKIDFDGLKME